MRKLVWILTLAWVSCNSATESTASSADTNQTTAAQQPEDTAAQQSNNPVAGCYRAVQGRDTILLQLNMAGNTVTGQMQYDNFEMDGSIGTIKGEVAGSRIRGYFTYASEGMWSVREIIFELRNGQLLQAGTGNLSFQKDTARFRGSLVLDEQRPFSSVPCSQVQFWPLPPKNL